MQYHVVVEKLCECAKRKNMPQIKSFDDKDTAFKIARAWANELNETFCGEHEFAVTQVDENYVISVD